MRGESLTPETREYPRTWLLLDVVGDGPRLLGHEIVDLSPGAIELRQAVRDLRGRGEERSRWRPLGERPFADGLAEEQRRSLSFGPELLYGVEHDVSRRLHAGRPFRHLRVRGRGRLTPATAAEIGLYFYGRRPAVFGFVRADTAHGFIGFDWEELSEEDVRDLLVREVRPG